MTLGSIGTIAKAVASGTVSATEVTEVSLARLRSIQPELNVLAFSDEEFSRTVASGVSGGVLAGVPLLVKDLEDIAGWPTKKASLTLKDAKAADTTSPTVAKYLAAGAVPVGKSTLPEFAFEGFTASTLCGVTRNPWNLDYSPGGSSGGSAAAISAGAAGIGTATDGGGSVRIPAAMCGLVGLKPTNGLIGRYPVPDWIDLSTDGIFTTSVADLELLLRVAMGPVHGDPTAPPLMVSQHVLDEVSTHRPRLIAALRTSDLGLLPSDVERSFTAAVGAMEALLGATATWRTPGTFFRDGDPDIDWFTLATVEHTHRLGRAFVSDHFDEFDVATKAFFEQGLATDVDTYMAARLRRFGYIREIDDLLGADGFLLTPTNAASGWLADGRVTASSEPGQLPPEVYSTAVQNVLGLPAITLPAGLLDNGVPFGVQITGPRWSEGQLLHFARLWEEAHPWPLTAPGYEPLDSFLS